MSSIIDFEKYLEKKKAAEQVRRLLEEGKTPADQYTDLLKKAYDHCREALECAQEYIDLLKGYISDHKEIIEAQEKYIKLLESK